MNDLLYDRVCHYIMNCKTLTLFFLFIFYFSSTSCNPIEVKRNNDKEFNNDKFGNNIRSFASKNFLAWSNDLATQGCAINDGILYQFRHSGIVDCSRITDKTIEYISTVVLESAGNNIHCNSVQFDSSGELVYVSSWSNARSCYVENLTISQSTLVQTIKVGAISDVPPNMPFNLQIGDDGFLWLVGCDKDVLRFIKFKRPDLSLKNAELTESDIIDKWERANYSYELEVYQGMKVYGGYLYLVYGGGGPLTRRGVWVYNTHSHQLVKVFDLSDVTNVEFEDIEFYNSKGYLFILDDCILQFDI